MSDGLFDHGRVPRRVFTTVRDGRSCVAEDGPVPNAMHHRAIPGMLSSVVFHSAASPSVPIPVEETAPAGRPLLPGPGETTLLVVQFPPDSVYASPRFDGAAAGAEQVEFDRGFAAHFDPDVPGMHMTDSLDYDIVLDGEITLELDDGTVPLSRGDVVVQNGTRHAWRNSSARPATLAFVLIGAQRN